MAIRAHQPYVCCFQKNPWDYPQLSSYNVFFPRRSTVTNFLSAKETVTQWFDKGGTVGIVYLEKIYSVNHRLLFIKLAPSLLNWVELFLRRLSFQVSFNGCLSQVAEATSGVPRG